jgi:hypothetical protein
LESNFNTYGTGEINKKGLWSRMVEDRANILENQIRLA